MLTALRGLVEVAFPCTCAGSCSVLSRKSLVLQGTPAAQVCQILHTSGNKLVFLWKQKCGAQFSGLIQQIAAYGKQPMDKALLCLPKAHTS